MTRFRMLAFGLCLAGALGAGTDDKQKSPPKSEAPKAAPAKAEGPKEEAAKNSVAKAIPVVGCSDTKMFHLSDCKWVKEVEKAGKRVDFPSKSAAKKGGMKPCGDCMPAKKP